MTFSELDPRTLTALGTAGALEAATSPRAPADVLSGLSAHPDARVRAQVALNPNTPAEVLGLLAAQFPREVLSNPGLPLLRLARPGLLGSFPAEGVTALLALPDAPGWVVDSALRHEDYGVRTALAARPGLSPSGSRRWRGTPGGRCARRWRSARTCPSPCCASSRRMRTTTCARPPRCAPTCPATCCGRW
ncbi:hypothetical protein [Deinococcus radiodurans]|uniref:hypothetical protein n=1 Tax=Deinococcus radiodurans TaxID=1299 RepID=UPI00312CA1C4